MTSFYYTIPTLINRVNLEVLHKIKNRSQIAGIGDNSIIDAEVLIKEYLQTIASEIYDKHTSPLARKLDELETPEKGYEFDISFTDTEKNETFDNCIVFRVQFPTTFDTDVTKAIERSIEDCLVSFAVYNWLMDSNIQGWELFERQHDQRMDRLIGLMNRRVKFRRTYKLY